MDSPQCSSSTPATATVEEEVCSDVEDHLAGTGRSPEGPSNAAAIPRDIRFISSLSTNPSCISFSGVTQQVSATPDLAGTCRSLREGPSDAAAIPPSEISFLNSLSTNPSCISFSGDTQQVPATPDLRKYGQGDFTFRHMRRRYKSRPLSLDVSTSTAQSCIHTPGPRFWEGNAVEEACLEGDTYSEASISTGTVNYIGNSTLGAEYDLHTMSERAKVPTSLALGNPAVITQNGDAAASDIQPLWDHHSDRMVVGDALLYCALFSPHHEFQKDQLIQLWMAAKFVVQDPMEYYADLFFEDCVTRGYIEFSRTDSVTKNALYKFKEDSDLVQSLLRSRGNNMIRIEGKSNLIDLSPNVCHVSIVCDDMRDSSVFHDCKKFKQVRTLMLLDGGKTSFKQVPRDFFQSLKMLKVLGLSQSHLMELPTCIGNMKLLCFLDLSDTPLHHLPEAIGNLQALQTLKLRGCYNLSSLPRCMRKLVNLRHLDFDVLGQLDSMPQGMGALTSIRTLSAFLVGTEEGCDITQLKNMNHLSGSFSISRLENVLIKEEAEEACLSNKSHLKKLELNWSDTPDKDLGSSAKVLSSLRPNTSLEELHISCYSGFDLPSWTCDPSFSELMSITLFECENCVSMSSLGQLPSLKYLNIVGFHKLRVIDHNFYRGQSVSLHIAFPRLEKLIVEDMCSLEEWLEIGSSNFPCLHKLTIKHCPKLYSLCSLSYLCSLENLEIISCPVLASCFDENLPSKLKTFVLENCPQLSARFSKDRGKDWLTVAHTTRMWIDHQETSFDSSVEQADAQVS